MSQSSEASIFAGITTECDKLFNTGNSAGVERFLLEHLSIDAGIAAKEVTAAT